MTWLDVATVLYVVAMAGGTGCGAYLRSVRMRHEDGP